MEQQGKEPWAIRSYLESTKRRVLTNVETKEYAAVEKYFTQLASTMEAYEKAFKINQRRQTLIKRANIENATELTDILAKKEQAERNLTRAKETEKLKLDKEKIELTAQVDAAKTQAKLEAEVAELEAKKRKLKLKLEIAQLKEKPGEKPEHKLRLPKNAGEELAQALLDKKERDAGGLFTSEESQRSYDDHALDIKAKWRKKGGSGSWTTDFF